VLGLSCAFADQSGFFYGNPSLGTIKFIDETTSYEQLFFDTLVSHPSSICINENNNTIFFGNNAPPVYFPWVSVVPNSGDEVANIFLNSSTSIPSTVTISDMTFDESSNSLFFMYKEINPTKQPFANQAFAVIQRFTVGEAGPVPVYTLDASAKVPNSFDIDPTNNTVYYSTNGVVHDAERSLGGIYSVDYNGENPRKVVNVTQLAEESYSIGSVQYSDDHLFYILESTVTRSAIYKYHLDSQTIEMVYNGTLFTPQQIVTVEVDGDTNIWVRDGSDFYQCIDEECDDLDAPTLSVSDDTILDFDVSSDESYLYYVSFSGSAVLSIDASDNSVDSVVNGISSATNIWASDVDDLLYFSAYNRIDIINFAGEWSNLGKYPFNIDYMTGDSSTGNLIVAESTGNIYSIINGEANMIVASDSISAIGASNGMLYYSEDSELYGYQSIINTCSIDNCQPAPFANVVEKVDSLSFSYDGTELYYSTIEGIFSVTANQPTIAYKKNVMPFALSYDTQRDILYFLDINISEENYTIFYCNTSDCSGTIAELLSINIPSNAKFALNGWMALDSSRNTLYWVASSLVGDVYRTNITTKTNERLFSTSEAITGISLANNGSTLLVSSRTSVTGYNVITEAGTVASQCNSLNNRSPVGDIDVNNNVLFWSDASTGNVYECMTDCTNCNTSMLVDVSNSTCSAWQFITVFNNDVYNQYGCGGIIKAPSDGSGGFVTLKNQGYDPIADLVVQSASTLFWGIPYRFSLIQGDATDDSVTQIETLYSGTGKFDDLSVTADNTFYWINEAASKIMKALPGAAIVDYIFQPAVGLTYFKQPVAPASPSPAPSMPCPSPCPTPCPTPCPSPCPSPSPCPTPTSLPSASATPLPSPSAANSSSSTPTTSSASTSSSTPTISITPTNSASGTLSLTSTVTITPSPGSPPSDTPSVSPTTSLTSTVTASETSSPSNSDTPSQTPSGSSTISDTATASLTVGASPSSTASTSLTSSRTPSVTPSDYFYGSQSNIPYLPYGEESSYESPLVSKQQWDRIGVVAAFVVILCVLPSLYFCWKRGVEREMAMSLRLPD